MTPSFLFHKPHVIAIYSFCIVLFWNCSAIFQCEYSLNGIIITPVVSLSNLWTIPGRKGSTELSKSCSNVSRTILTRVLL